MHAASDDPPPPRAPFFFFSRVQGARDLDALKTFAEKQATVLLDETTA